MKWQHLVTVNKLIIKGVLELVLVKVIFIDKMRKMDLDKPLWPIIFVFMIS